MKIKLVVRGGGTRYPVYVGFQRACEARGIKIEEAVGTSAGAIYLGGLSAGRNSFEMEQLFKSLLPGDFIDPRWFPFWPFASGKDGLIKGDKFLEACRKYFPMSYESTRMPVHIVTHNWTRGTNRIFSDGDLPLHVRASMSLPIFDMVEIKNHLYEDGGVSGNFMMDFDGWTLKSKAPTWGIALKSERDFSFRAPPKTKIARISATINDMIDANDREHIEDAEKHSRIIYLRTKHPGMNLFMSPTDVEEMIKEGQNSAERAFSKMGL